MDTFIKEVRTRVAPSPTGFPHLGLIYQAIFDFVLAHAYKGKFILRIEDTDKNRFVEGAEKVIYDSLRWVNLLPDEGPQEGGPVGPYRQSERLELYKKYAEELIEKGHAYRCFCTKERLEQMRKIQEKKHQPPMYDRTCVNLSLEDVNKKIEEKLSFVIRMKIPEKRQITVHDEIVGNVTFNSDQIDDQVILKTDGFPTYHLAVVVDDYLMKITHVFRGTEWLPSYPKHVLLWEYLGWAESMPKFIHIPVLLNSVGGGKLSKRHAHTSIMYYREEGYLPEAVVNYLANIVWNHPEGKEIFPIMDFGKAFNLTTSTFDIKATGVKFDLEKLRWMNGMYIRQMSVEELSNKLQNWDTALKKLDPQLLQKIVQLAQTRMSILKDFTMLAKHFWEEPEIVIYENEKSLIYTVSTKLEETTLWNSENILIILKQILVEYKIKMSVLYRLLTGQERSLPLSETLEILGKEKVLERLSRISS